MVFHDIPTRLAVVLCDVDGFKPTAHDASFLAGSLAGRYYAGCAAPSQAGHNVGLASYGAGCRAGLQARCSSFVAHYS